MMSSFDTSHSLNAYFLDYSFIYSLHAALHAFIPFGGIAVPTNVTLGNCLPSMLCVVDVYLTVVKAFVLILNIMIDYEH